MKRSHLILTLAFFFLLLVVAAAGRTPVSYGGVPVSGWFGLFFFFMSIGVALVITDSRASRRRVLAQTREAMEAPPKPESAPLPPTMIDPAGLPYPHPVINVATCIGCHACVDACPHDVLAIVNGKAAPVALEQCMEDTSCQVECPTVPKSCIVVNTTKPIPERKVPQRGSSFETNVPGVYLIGDVSGVPLIKNAINEGGAVIEAVIQDLKASPAPAADYDVAIVGIGPAGLSATALAHQRGLKYVAIEQDQIVATIQQTYQAGKYVFFNPVDQPVRGGIRLDGAGASKEAMISAWMETVASNGLRINEFESCRNVQREGDLFVVETEQDRTKEQLEYRARRVILAIGNRGTPMRLRVPGEDLRVSIASGQTVLPQFCNKCGARRVGENRFCHECGNKYIPKAAKPVEDDKVKYRLSDPKLYSGKQILVVGAGNSAIEAAVDLAAVRSDDGGSIVAWRDNTVSLLIRSNFKGDLKLGNKMMVYQCIDEGRIKAYFGQTVKEITPNEVALMSARERDPKTAAETARIPNDYVFALIGGEKPTKFLESIGIRIG